MSKKNINLIVLVIISGLFFLIQLGNPLAGGHSDEPLYIGIARDMMARHDWVIPTFHGEPAFYKPPLLYWMMIIAFKLFGQSTLFAARFPAAVCGVLAVLFAALLGRELFGERDGIAPSALPAGSLAGWLAATTIPGLYAYGRAALMDIPLVCFITASLYFAVRAAKEKRAGFLIAALICFALTSLLKGPVGLLIPILPVLWIFHKEKSWRLFLTWQSCIGMILAGAIILWWPIAVYARGEWNNWLHFFIVQENFGKFNRQFDPTTKATPGSVVWIHLLSQFMPWSFFLLAAVLLFLIKKENRDSSSIFLLLWIAGVVLIFLLPEKKLSHYTLPAIPPTALLVAGIISKNRTASISKIAFYCTAIITAIVPIVLFALSSITSESWIIILSAFAFLFASYSLIKGRLQSAAYGIGIFLILFAFGLPGLMSTMHVNTFKEAAADQPAYSYKIDLAIVGASIQKEIPYIENPEALKGKSGVLAVRESDEIDLTRAGIKLSKPILSWTAWKDHIRLLELLHAITARDKAFLHQPIAAVYFEASEPVRK